MGQYYRPILTNAKGEQTVYNRNVDGEYTMAKLMEHSWWLNGFVSTITKMLFENPMRVVWVGDYSSDSAEVNDLTSSDLETFCKTAWKRDDETDNSVGVSKDELFLDGLYLVNHTKRAVLDCSMYKAKSDQNGWCIHPLPLLTAIGNGLGGGDYRGVNMSDIGSWANDIISVENHIPENYIVEGDYEFWEEW